LPPVLADLVLTTALAVVMSTSSRALIATATVFSQDIVARLRGRDIEAARLHLQQPSLDRQLACELLVIAVSSLLSKSSTPEVMAEWNRRSRGEQTVPQQVTDATI
jgi:Na+/pantothenate symporter